MSYDADAPRYGSIESLLGRTKRIELPWELCNEDYLRRVLDLSRDGLAACILPAVDARAISAPRSFDGRSQGSSEPSEWDTYSILRHLKDISVLRKFLIWLCGGNAREAYSVLEEVRMHLSHLQEHRTRLSHPTAAHIRLTDDSTRTAIKDGIKLFVKLTRTGLRGAEAGFALTNLQRLEQQYVAHNRSKQRRLAGAEDQNASDGSATANGSSGEERLTNYNNRGAKRDSGVQTDPSPAVGKRNSAVQTDRPPGVGKREVAVQTDIDAGLSNGAAASSTSAVPLARAEVSNKRGLQPAAAPSAASSAPKPVPAQAPKASAAQAQASKPLAAAAPAQMAWVPVKPDSVRVTAPAAPLSASAAAAPAVGPPPVATPSKPASAAPASSASTTATGESGASANASSIGSGNTSSGDRWPPSLQAWTLRAIQTGADRAELHRRAQQAAEDGSLWARDWSREPLPKVPAPAPVTTTPAQVAQRMAPSFNTVAEAAAASQIAPPFSRSYDTTTMPASSTSTAPPATMPQFAFYTGDAGPNPFDITTLSDRIGLLEARLRAKGHRLTDYCMRTRISEEKWPRKGVIGIRSSLAARPFAAAMGYFEPELLVRRERVHVKWARCSRWDGGAATSAAPANADATTAAFTFAPVQQFLRSGSGASGASSQAPPSLSPQQEERSSSSSSSRRCCDTPLLMEPGHAIIVAPEGSGKAQAALTAALGRVDFAQQCVQAIIVTPAPLSMKQTFNRVVAEGCALQQQQQGPKFLALSEGDTMSHDPSYPFTAHIIAAPLPVVAACVCRAAGNDDYAVFPSVSGVKCVVIDKTDYLLAADPSAALHQLGMVLRWAVALRRDVKVILLLDSQPSAEVNAQLLQPYLSGANVLILGSH